MGRTFSQSKIRKLICHLEKLQEKTISQNVEEQSWFYNCYLYMFVICTCLTFSLFFFNLIFVTAFCYEPFNSIWA